MSNFTKGEWKVRRVDNPSIPGHSGFAIDFNEDQEQVVDFVYKEADANLIAASKELYEALKTVGSHVITDENGDDVEVLYGDLDKIAAALRKADGERS
jgi:hypothetical protein